MGHPIFARFYARTSQAMERGVARHRDQLLAGLTGTVIEVGAGNGMNFAHYPEDVTSVLAVEPEPHLRRLAEAVRVLRPGGQLRFFEHVRAEGRLSQAVQRLLQMTVFPILSGGCHPARDTKTTIENAGFTINELQHLAFADTQLPFPASPQILGTATTRSSQSP